MIQSYDHLTLELFVVVLFVYVFAVSFVVDVSVEVSFFIVHYPRIFMYGSWKENSGKATIGTYVLQISKIYVF